MGLEELPALLGLDPGSNRGPRLCTPATWVWKEGPVKKRKVEYVRDSVAGVFLRRAMGSDISGMETVTKQMVVKI